MLRRAVGTGLVALLLAAPVSAQESFTGWESSWGDFSRMWQGAIANYNSGWEYAIRGANDASVPATGDLGATAPAFPYSLDYTFSYDGDWASLALGDGPAITADVADGINSLALVSNAYSGAGSQTFDIKDHMGTSMWSGTLVSSSGPSGWGVRYDDLGLGFEVSGTVTRTATSGSFDPGFYINAGSSTNPAASVPEPASLLLLVSGLLGMVFLERRRANSEA